MTLGNCPLCGSLVRARDVKPYSRLTCSKCHADLHLNKDRNLAIGDPPDVEAQLRELKQEVQHLAKRFPTRQVVIGLAVLLALGLGWNALFGPAERLGSVAEKAARALAEDNPDALESLAAPDTAADLRRWYDAIHPRLVHLREQWGTAKNEVVEARVAQEDRDQHRGAVLVTIGPVVSGARDVSLANPSEAIATAAASSAFEEATDWTLTRWGRWKLDGRATYARFAGTAAAR